MTPDDPRLPPPENPGPPARPGPPGPSGPPGPPGGDGGHGDGGHGDGIDELASSLLDGMLVADVAAEARQRPEVMARLAELEAARAELRDTSIPAPEPAAREQAIGAALAAFDDEAATAGAESPEAGAGAPWDTPPTEIAARRHGRAARPQGAPRWLGAAAAVAVLVAAAAGLASLGTLDDGGDDTAATGAADMAPPDERLTEESEDDSRRSTDAAQDDAGSAGAEAEAGGEAGGDAGDGGSPAPSVARTLDVGDLGDFASPEELADGMRARLAATTASGGTEFDDGSVAPATDPLADLHDRCDREALPAPLDDRAAPVQLRGHGTLDGRDVDVAVVRAPTGDRIVAVDPSCAVVVDEPLR